MTMTSEQFKAKYPSFVETGKLDNSEWVKGVEKGRKKLAPQGKKMFVYLDKNASGEENLKILKKAIDKQK